MDLQDRIAAARKSAGLSQEQLGEKLGVSRQAVSKWESGQSRPDIEYIISMSRLFEMSTDQLLTGEEPNPGEQLLRCSTCGAIVTPMDDFCSKCGHAQNDEAPSRYTVLALESTSPTLAAEKLRSLFKGHSVMPAFSDNPHPSLEEYGRALSMPPQILCHDLPGELVTKLVDELGHIVTLEIYRERGARDPSELSKIDEVAPEALKPKKEPLSFGGAVLAVIVGVVVAILVLSIL